MNLHLIILSFKIRRTRIVNLVKHKKAFAKKEKELLGRYTLNSITHDLDKLLMYCLFVSIPFTRRTHKKYAKHHNPKNKLREIERVIDWECARDTKPNSPMTALQYAKSANKYKDVKSTLAFLGLKK